MTLEEAIDRAQTQDPRKYDIEKILKWYVKGDIPTQMADEIALLDENELDSIFDVDTKQTYPDRDSMYQDIALQLEDNVVSYFWNSMKGATS